MGHWLHTITGRERMLAAHAAGEDGAETRRRVEAWLVRCPGCRARHRAYQAAIAALRSVPCMQLSTGEAATFWPAVARRIEAGARPPAHRPRPGIREMLWDHPRLGLASAATAAVFVITITLAQLGLWGALSTSTMSGVEVIEVDVDEDAPVMVFEAPGSALTVIWVFEDRSS